MDIEAEAENRGRDIIHGVVSEAESIAQQNFDRGYISCCERILNLARDLQEWKESRKNK